MCAGASAAWLQAPRSSSTAAAILPSAAARATSAEAPRCLAPRSAATPEGLADSTVRSGGDRGPWGCLRARCSERSSCRRARELPELATPVSALVLRRAPSLDAVSTAACAQAHQRRGFKRREAAAQLQRFCRRRRRALRRQKRRAASPPPAQRRLRVWQSQRCDLAVPRAVGLLARTLQ